jgi:hypothetical protein
MAVRELDVLLRYYDPEIEWISTGDYIERATYRGHDGIGRNLGTMEEEFTISGSSRWT